MDWLIEYYQKENGEIPVVLLHGFVKKANKLPERELDRTLDYKNDYERRCQDE